MLSSQFSLPRPLKKGGTIGIAALSGAVDASRLTRGVAALQALGYRVVVAPHATNSHEYFSAPDDVRLADFHALVADSSVDAIIMARGGYGLSRIVHRIDWQAVRASNKVFCGFSDFTAFNLAALAHANLVTLAGAMVAVDFGDEEYAADVAEAHAFTETHLLRLLHGEPDQIDVVSTHPYVPQQLQGPIWGSNLSLLAHMVGTPHLPTINDGILFIEEIGEQPYAIERMFLQLFHAGILQSQRAIVLGDFSDCEPSAGRFPYAMEHVIKTLRQLLPCPVLTDLPFGHVPKKLTIPFGATATLDITTSGYALSY
jgi:muramoyltetrapeptide carboxypeptidase